MLKGGVKKTEEKKEEEYVAFDKDKHLTIGVGDPRLAYNEKKYPNKNSISFPPMKFLLSEMEFLCFYLDTLTTPDVNIVWNHVNDLRYLPTLLFFFPFIQGHVYNCEKDDVIQTDEGKGVINLYKREVDVERWSNRDNVFFIGNLITSTREEDNLTEEDKKIIEEDLISFLHKLRKMVEDIKPKESLLRIRFPYNYKWQDKNFTYLSGLLYTQPWDDADSSELCLVVNKPYTDFSYDISAYESLTFHYKKITRQKNKFYNIFNNDPVPISIPLSLFNDYDSILTTYIMSEYIVKHSQQPTEETTLLFLQIMIDRMRKDTGKSIFMLRSKI
jgi:hypothetical protein